ncbi:MAG: hypothetical protein J6L69_03050 [Lachnospiraceae bacterium]|nr:hypothetical protein [Lachnospiraceae bacterium]
MANVIKFNLDGQEIDVKDNEARTLASSASSQVSSLGTRVTALENQSKLSISYDTSTETITFTTGTHK